MLLDVSYLYLGVPESDLILKEEEKEVDNDEDCDGVHLAVSYRRQHRLLASYLEMVQAGADLCYSSVSDHGPVLDPWCQFEPQH